MWVLLILMMNLQTGHETPYKLNEFPVKKLCKAEEKRIANEMAQAYPGDRDYRIICQRRTR